MLAASLSPSNRGGQVRHGEARREDICKSFITITTHRTIIFCLNPKPTWDRVWTVVMKSKRTFNPRMTPRKKQRDSLTPERVIPLMVEVVHEEVNHRLMLVREIEVPVGQFWGG
jgi:hypothetical protein